MKILSTYKKVNLRKRQMSFRNKKISYNISMTNLGLRSWNTIRLYRRCNKKNYNKFPHKLVENQRSSHTFKV